METLETSFARCLHQPGELQSLKRVQVGLHLIKDVLSWSVYSQEEHKQKRSLCFSAEQVSISRVAKLKRGLIGH